MISDKKRIKVELCIYANVASEFAIFNNPRYRGKKFTWDFFIQHCENNSDLWIALADICVVDSKVKKYSAKFAKETATYLVELLTE